MKEDQDEAKKFLTDFFEQMYKWESKFINTEELYDSGEMLEEEFEKEYKLIREDLINIFEMFCEAGSKAKRLRDVGLTYSIPPEYDIKAHPIVSEYEQKGIVVLETEPISGLGFRFKYELVKIDGEWKIRDNRKFATLTENSKWKAGML